jgi:hypothetical protein
VPLPAINRLLTKADRRNNAVKIKIPNQRMQKTGLPCTIDSEDADNNSPLRHSSGGSTTHILTGEIQLLIVCIKIEALIGHQKIAQEVILSRTHSPPLSSISSGFLRHR